MKEHYYNISKHLIKHAQIYGMFPGHEDFHEANIIGETMDYRNTILKKVKEIKE